MRFGFLLNEVLTGLRRNVTMTIAMILTTAISIGLFGGGLLVVQMADNSRASSSTASRARSSSPTTSPPTTRPATPILQVAARGDRGPRRRAVGAVPQPRRRLQRRDQEVPAVQGRRGQGRFPASFMVKLDDPEQHKDFDDSIAGQPGVLNVLNQKDLIDRLFAVLDGVQRRVRDRDRAGDRRGPADRQHGSNRRVHPTNRGRHHAIGRREPLVHAVAVPARGDARRADRCGHRDRRPVHVRALFLENALNQFYEANIIARVDYADILYIAPILVFVGVAMAASPPTSPCGCTSEDSHGQESRPDEGRATRPRSSRPIARRGTTTRSSRRSRPGSRWWAPR